MYGAHDRLLVTTCVVQEAQKKWLREFIVQFLPNLLRVSFSFNEKKTNNSICKVFLLCLLRTFVQSF